MAVITASMIAGSRLEGAEHGATISLILDRSEPGQGPRLHQAGRISSASTPTRRSSESGWSSRGPARQKDFPRDRIGVYRPPWLTRNPT